MKMWPVLLLRLLPGETAPDADEWVARTFGPEFDERFARAFDSAWRATFGSRVDPAVRGALESAFREAFERALRETLEDVAAEEKDDDGLWGRRRLLSSNYDPRRVRWEDVFAYDDPAERLERLDVRTVNGKIHIRGEETDRVRLHVTRVIRARDEAVGEAFRKQFRPMLHRLEGRALFVETPSNDQIDWPRNIEEARMDYEIVVPASFAVHAVSVNGRVEAEGVNGGADLRTVNGAVSLRSIEGIEDAVRMETVNGNLNVELGRLGRGAHLKTVNGSITATVREFFAGGLEAKSLNGGIAVALPEDAAFHLYAKTTHGRIETDWGKPPHSGQFLSELGRRFEVDVNGGGDPVRLEAFHGAIEVRIAD